MICYRILRKFIDLLPDSPEIHDLLTDSPEIHGSATRPRPPITKGLLVVVGGGHVNTKMVPGLVTGHNHAGVAAGVGRAATEGLAQFTSNHNQVIAAC